MKIYNGPEPKNPHRQRHADNTWSETSASRFYTEGQLSILNECKEVDLDKQFFKYIHIHFGEAMAEQLYNKPLFSKFIFQTPQEQLPTRTDIGDKPW